MLDVRSVSGLSLPTPRKPLASLKPSPAAAAATLKRPRSPEPTARAAKRPKSEHATPVKLSREERERQKEEFRVKYTQAFPGWTFYFDELDPKAKNVLGPRVVQLGGKIEPVFSNAVSHVITNQQIGEHKDRDKENAHAATPSAKAALAALKSPIKLRGRTDDNGLVAKAKQLEKKIWSAEKLLSILDRLLDDPDAATAAAKKRQQLTKQAQSAPRNHSATNPIARQTLLAAHAQKNAPSATLRPKGMRLVSARDPSKDLGLLLQTERLRGATTERDPTARRNDYKYFKPNSHYILIEDIRGELATIAHHEYQQPSRQSKAEGAAKKARQGDTPWPTLYADPRSHCPFAPYDKKAEERRRAREEETRLYDEQVAAKKRELALKKRAAEMGTLRRATSLGDLRRAQQRPSQHAAAALEEPNASGFANSAMPGTEADSTAYWAASGNSVSITSTAASTTSFAGALRGLALGPGSRVTLPAALREKLRLETKLTAANVNVDPALVDMDDKENVPAREDEDRARMPPPNANARLLKKSKSTNTLKVRMQAREEAKRAGYCENCRTRYEDIKEHTNSKKHRRFANDAQNFLELDVLLSKVVRRPLPKCT
ncbi:hypothetical protein AURDEDRAFT_183476 [Auricularia subglabra TFB-10046 SS5]|nr:hypothetical protein AURDEDRAFT_183476 [Auricularia subglabra TFB-10046 SS5]